MAGSSMRFHTSSHSSPMRLPIALGHFMPWFTINAGDFPLSPAQRATIPHFPQLDDHRHWREARSSYRRSHQQMPEIGTYDSRDPKVIRWQIEAAKFGGIDGFIINWYGQNSSENVITLSVLDELERWNRDHTSDPFVYFFSIDSQAQMNTEGKTPATLPDDLRYLQKYLMTPSYLHRDGRPVFSCFPYKANLPEWISAFDEVFSKSRYDFLWMYDAQGGGETGCFVWVRPDADAMDGGSMYPWPDPGNTGSALASELYAQWSEKKFAHQYGMAGVWPGFNDTLVAWAWKNPEHHPRTRPRIIARESDAGNTYRILWETYFAVLRDPARLPLPLVQIITWNDWAETTTIEPAKDYGREYLTTTKKFVTQAREIWSKRFAE